MPAGNVAQNHRSTAFERAAQDWYVEPRFCVEQLADAVSFEGHWIWDPCCGGGNITDTFADRGHPVIATDIVERGARHFDEIWDATNSGSPLCVPPGARVSVVTNPPFNRAEAIVRQTLKLADHRVAVLQQLSFLASAGRWALFDEFPPSDVLILSKRPSMPPGHMIAELGEKAFRGGVTDFCWIIWSRPHDRETRVRWLPPKLITEGVRHDG
jgi:hypothetical protein